MTETPIMQRIRLSLAEIGVITFRNNVGTLKDERGRHVTFGLCVGSSDLIGWRSVVITPAMVGRTVAQFIACEVKQPGKRPSDEQINFIDAVNKAGGLAFVATSSQEALAAIQR